MGSLFTWLSVGCATGAQSSSNLSNVSLESLFPATPKVATRPMDSNAPVSIEAQSVAYDKDNAIAVAIGNVVVVQGDYVLHADRVTYFQSRDRIEATGNVSVLQPTGDVYFADHVELRDDLKRGAAKALKARLYDNSLLASTSAKKINESLTVMNKAVYSPCKVCTTGAPFWQIKARQITVDNLEEKITFRDPRLEMFGIPTFYSPYLSGPTPNAAGQSGFMPPTYTGNTNLGAGIQTPYYWRIGEDKDLMITPWLLSVDSSVLQTNYRQLLDDGTLAVDLSATNPQRRDSAGATIDGNEFRGHIAANGMKNIDRSTRVGFDINRATDQTYLARYGFSRDQVLFSRLYGETVEQRNAASIETLAIQGLRVGDNPKTTPSVAPTIEGYYETEPDENGARLHITGNAQSLMREVGADQRRLSVTGGVSYPYITDGGQVINASASLRQDLYDVNDATMTGSATKFQKTTARSIPQTALQWRYPLIHAGNGDALTIEPIALGVMQPDGSNHATITNEDSRSLELSDTNLFDIDRVPGYDVVDSGSRLAYGIRGEYLLQGGETMDVLLGQNYSVSANTPFPNSTTPGEHRSDIIGRAGFNIAPIAIAYRFTLNPEDFTPNRNQLSVGFTRPWLLLAASYNSVSQTPVSSTSEQLDLSGKLPLSEEWSLYGSTSRDLNLNRMITSGAGIIYHNECFDFALDGIRVYTEDRDVGSNTSFSARIAFKNLGVFGG